MAKTTNALSQILVQLSGAGQEQAHHFSESFLIFVLPGVYSPGLEVSLADLFERSVI
jgi:hypothetical protein